MSKDGTLKIRGFESVRRDKCDLAKEIQEFVIKKVLDEGKAELQLRRLAELADQDLGDGYGVGFVDR